MDRISSNETKNIRCVFCARNFPPHIHVQSELKKHGNENS